jgi:hypothetical protein
LAEIDLTPLPASAKGSTGQLHNLEMSVEANRNRHAIETGLPAQKQLPRLARSEMEETMSSA